MEGCSVPAVEKSTVRDGGWFCNGSREKYNGSREKHSEGTEGGSVPAVEKSIMAVEKSTVRGWRVVL